MQGPEASLLESYLQKLSKSCLALLWHLSNGDTVSTRVQHLAAAVWLLYRPTKFPHQIMSQPYARTEDLSSYKAACFHVRRGQVGLENLSQLSWGSLKCLYVGKCFWVKRNEVVWRGKRKWSELEVPGMKWVTSLLWLMCNQIMVLTAPACLSWFFITSTISGVPSRNVSFQYWNSTNGRYRKTTETSTKTQKEDRVFSCPYHWRSEERR